MSGVRRRYTPSYPYDGLSIADSPLGYVDNGDAEKEQAFLDLQEYLLSDEVQNEIQRTGRRTGYEGVSAETPTCSVPTGRPAGSGALPYPDALHRCAHGVPEPVSDRVPQALPHSLLPGLLRLACTARAGRRW